MFLTTGLSGPEGPVALADGSWLVVEMGEDRGCITHIAPGRGNKQVIARTGRLNGLAVDRNGVIWVAKSQNTSLLRVSMEGDVEVLLTGRGAEPFLFPNDLCFGPDGTLYMTVRDSVRGFRPGGHCPGGLQEPRL